MRPVRQLALLFAFVALAISACAGASPLAGGNDPAGVARQALSVLSTGDVTKLTDLACAANKDDIAQAFTGGLGDLAPGTDPGTVLRAIKLDTSKVIVGDATVTGDTAVVPIKGSMTMSIDPDKAKPIIQAALKAQGVAADDAAVNAAMGMLTTLQGQPIPLDESLTLKQENGAWKICQAA